MQNEVIVNQNGNELLNNGKSTEEQKGDNWGEVREEYDKGGKNTKIKETIDRELGEPTKRRNIGRRRTNDLQ